MQLRPWKTVLATGTACAVCCAVPLMGGTAAIGTSALAATSASYLACAGEFIPGVVGALILAIAAAAFIVWRRRAAQRAARPCEGASCAD